MRIFVLAATLALATPAFAQVPQVPRGNALNPERETIKKHYDAGWALMHSEDWDGAVKEFNSVIEIDPSFGNAYYSLGRAEMGRRQYQKAIDAYLKCKEVYAANGGRVFSSQLDGKQALEDQLLDLQMALNQAVLVKQSSPSQQLYIQELRNKMSYLQTSRDRQQNVTIDTSVPYFVPMALGSAYFKLGKYDAAEAEYKAALAENSASGETHSNLAVLYMITGRLHDAEGEVKAAEKTGFKVNGQFKEDLSARLKATGSR